VAEIVQARDITDPSQHGWAVDCLIQREDRGQLHVDVRCWDKHATPPNGRTTPLR
jgi:hypothetical protein